VPLIDRDDIYAFEDWWQRIEALIIKEPGALQYLHHHRWVD
jgi:hypothetical protein